MRPLLDLGENGVPKIAAGCGVLHSVMQYAYLSRAGPSMWPGFVHESKARASEGGWQGNRQPHIPGLGFATASLLLSKLTPAEGFGNSSVMHHACPTSNGWRECSSLCRLPKSPTITLRRFSVRLHALETGEARGTEGENNMGKLTMQLAPWSSERFRTTKLIWDERPDSDMFTTI